jgi:flagellar protein FlbD
MILVHRLRGEAMFLNADLIESVEAAPDTIVTLVDGRRVVVSESPEDVLERITAFRASVIVAAEDLRSGSRPVLRAVPPVEG